MPNYQLTADLVDGQVQITGNANGNLNVPKGSPPTVFTFNLHDNTGLNVEFLSGASPERSQWQRLSRVRHWQSGPDRTDRRPIDRQDRLVQGSEFPGRLDRLFAVLLVRQRKHANLRPGDHQRRSQRHGSVDAKRA